MDHVIQTPLWSGVELTRIWSLTLILTIVTLMIVVLVVRPLISLMVVVLATRPLIPLMIWLGILVVPLVIPLMRWHIGAPWVVLIPISPISMVLIPVPQLQLPLLTFP